MTIKTSVLKGQLDWAGVMLCIGYEPGAALPATVDCKECKGLLTLYPDKHYRSWFHCAGCGDSGDVLQLAMRHFKSDPTTAIKKAHQSGAFIMTHHRDPRYISSYEANYLKPRLESQEFRDYCSKQFFQDNEQMQLLHEQLNMDPYYAPDRWQQMMGRHVGHSTLNKAAYYLGAPFGMRKGKKAENNYQWTDLVVVTYQDLPGRICAFECIGKHGRQEDRVFQLREHLEGEAGFAFYDNLLSYSNQFGEIAFVMGDLAEALRLHSRWYKEHNNPLPLGVYHDGKDAWTSKEAWGNLPRREWILWSDKADSTIFAQASSCNGKVVIKPHETGDKGKYQLWLNKLVKYARKWDEVLETHMPRLSDPELQQILYKLNLDSEQWRTFMHDRTRASRERIKFLTGMDWPVKRVYLTTRTSQKVEIVEHDTGWYVNGNLITNVRMRVQQLWMKNDEVWARGVLKIKNKAYKFEAKEQDLRPDRSNVLRSNLGDILTKTIVKGNGPMPVFDPYWLDKLYDIAKLFKRPRVWTTSPT